MKKTFKFIPAFIFAALLIFQGCKNEYYQLSDEEQAEWMPYGKREQIVFSSTQGDVDTFKIAGLYKAYRDGYNEFLDAPITKLRDTVDGETEGGVFLYKTSSGLSVTARLPHYYTYEELTNKPLQFVTVGGLSYSDVIILTANPFYLDNNTYIDTMYYSKSFGFIKYVDINGEEWTIMN